MSTINTFTVNNQDYNIVPTIKTLNNINLVGEGDVSIRSGTEIATTLQSVLVDLWSGSRSFGSNWTFNIPCNEYPFILIKLKTSTPIYYELIIPTEYFISSNSWQVVMDVDSFALKSTSDSYISFCLHVNISATDSSLRLEVNVDKYSSNGGTITYIGGLLYANS